VSKTQKLFECRLWLRVVGHVPGTQSFAARTGATRADVGEASREETAACTAVVPKPWWLWR